MAEQPLMALKPNVAPGSECVSSLPLKQGYNTMITNHQMLPHPSTSNMSHPMISGQNYSLLRQDEVEDQNGGQLEGYSDSSACLMEKPNSNFSHRGSSTYLQHHQLPNTQQMRPMTHQMHENLPHHYFRMPEYALHQFHHHYQAPHI
ncbi:uncharacterized protein [Hetaerina americana]|uniref:uncharacterized protein n=1 Tax=Hetaerina americana TaxID=62018 RepID=UPI003A7F3EB2